MKYGTEQPKVTAEKNNSPKLTIPVKTRTPLEAYQMLLAGQPVDQIGQMYHVQDKVDKDFFMMDKTEKLRKIAELRAQSDTSKTDIEYYTKLYNESLLKQKLNEQTESNPQGGNADSKAS